MPIQTFGFEAWDMMGKQIDWAAVPLICDLLGIDNPAELVDDLLTIRRHVQKLIEAQSG